MGPAAVIVFKLVKVVECQSSKPPLLRARRGELSPGIEAPGLRPRHG